MSDVLVIALIVFAIVWIGIIIYNIRKDKISIRHSLVWFLMALVVLFIGILPGLMEYITELMGFETISNFVIGIILSLLMIITLALTKIVTKQKEQIKILTQEISIIKEEIKHEK